MTDKSQTRPYGVRENPIRLLPETSKRNLLFKCRKLLGSEDYLTTEGFNIDIGKVYGRDDFYDSGAYIMNLISNPNLSMNALRLGLWLLAHIDYSTLADMGIYDIRDNEEKLSSKGLGGEIGKIYIGQPNRKSPEFEWLPESKLVSQLRKLNLNFTKAELVGALEELHDFYYITVTDICYQNSYEASQENNYEPKKIDLNTQLAFVSLTRPMMSKVITTIWSSFDPSFDFETERNADR